MQLQQLLRKVGPWPVAPERITVRLLVATADNTGEGSQTLHNHGPAIKLQEEANINSLYCNAITLHKENAEVWKKRCCVHTSTRDCAIPASSRISSYCNLQAVDFLTASSFLPNVEGNSGCWRQLGDWWTRCCCWLSARRGRRSTCKWGCWFCWSLPGLWSKAGKRRPRGPSHFHGACRKDRFTVRMTKIGKMGFLSSAPGNAASLQRLWPRAAGFSASTWNLLSPPVRRAAQSVNRVAEDAFDRRDRIFWKFFQRRRAALGLAECAAWFPLAAATRRVRARQTNRTGFSL